MLGNENTQDVDALHPVTGQLLLSFGVCDPIVFLFFLLLSSCLINAEFFNENASFVVVFHEQPFHWHLLSQSTAGCAIFLVPLFRLRRKKKAAGQKGNSGTCKQ